MKTYIFTFTLHVKFNNIQKSYKLHILHGFFLDQKNGVRILSGKEAEIETELVAVTEIVFVIMIIGAETVIGIMIVVVIMTDMTVIEKEVVIQGVDIDHVHGQGIAPEIMIVQGFISITYYSINFAFPNFLISYIIRITNF